jgi:hypothetical protein
MSQGLFDRDVERRLRLLEAVATFTTLDARYVAVPTAWTAVTFAGAWVNFGAPYSDCQYRKVGDTVQLRGMMKSGTMVTTAFTLPAGFRPPTSLFMATVSNAAFGSFTIDSAGAFTPQAGTNAYVSITCSFSVSS